MMSRPAPVERVEDASPTALAPEAPARSGGLRAGRVRDVLITVLGVIGITTIGWLVVAWMFQLSVIVFVTGSMEPTIPTGSAAIVRTVPAADLEVGDVVTLTRHNSAEPVTHRIVAIAPVAGDDDRRALTLQGDANDFPDSDDYRVSEAPRVLASIPVLGHVFLWTKTPLAMVVLSIIIGSAIAWALWPTREPVSDADTPHL